MIREGEPGDRVYVIRRGRVRVSKRGTQVAELSAGDYFGEIALLRDVPRRATVTAIDDVEILSLERDEFLSAVTGSPPSRLRIDEEVERAMTDG